MATRGLIFLPLLCICVQALPKQFDVLLTNNSIIRNTIFADEKLRGEIFENVDIYDKIDWSSRNNEISPYRLPTTTKPTHYTLFWSVDFSPAIPTLAGTVAIQLYATQDNVSEIVLHADLPISDVVLTSGNTQVPITYSLDTPYQFMRVRLTSGILNYNVEVPQIYVLTISFADNLRDDMSGIYRSWYRNNANDIVRWMASSQFAPYSARYAFPCYDEPSFKATFDVTIRRHMDYESWFNTRLRATTVPETAPQYRDDEYFTTPIMSTYLLAMIVAQYDNHRVNSASGQLIFEVIGRPGAIQSGQGLYALDIGQKLLDEMSDITNYDYYTQHDDLKMTHASIPDFDFGAMENWGLITYREAYLMYDENETNGHFKQIIAYIVSHEIAHMWFGNLVTCDWWDALWLNEGFARYYQYYLTDLVTDMGFVTRFITEQVHTALLSDSANNPHPLTNYGVASPTSVMAMFSTISYNKGAAIIRMTEHLLGADVAKEGLVNYLRGKEFETAVPLDLFEYQERAGIAHGALNYNEFSFIDYYKSWTEQAGHPVLNVHVNHQTGDMTIYQRRFNINTGYNNNNNNNYIVPITFATASNPDFSNTKPTHIISKAITIINRGSIGDEWVIFNKQQTGFYRVNYDDYTWDLIVIALRGANRTLIHEFNRAQIVNDVFQFARSGLMSYSRALNILSFLEYETDYAPWVAAITGFTWLRNRLASEATATQLTQINDLIIMWSANLMNGLGFNEPIAGEGFLRSYLRLQMGQLWCNIGAPVCLDSARYQLQALILNAIPVPVDNRNWVYCSGLRQGGQVEFDYLWNRFLNHNVDTEKVLLLQNLGCTSDVASLNTFLTNIVTSNNIIRVQDYTTAFSSAVNGNEENTEIVFNFIRDNPTIVASAFGGSLVIPLSYITARLRSVERIDEYIGWANQNQALLGDAFNSLINDTEIARESIAWAQSVQTDISNYVQTGGDAVTSSTAAPVSVTTPSTTQLVPIDEPVTPALPEPNSATKAFQSFVIVFAVIVRMIL